MVKAKFDNGKYEKALNKFHELLKIFEKIFNTKENLEISFILSCIAENEGKLKNHHEALRIFERVLKIRK